MSRWVWRRSHYEKIQNTIIERSKRKKNKDITFFFFSYTDKRSSSISALKAKKKKKTVFQNQLFFYCGRLNVPLMTMMAFSFQKWINISFNCIIIISWPLQNIWRSNFPSKLILHSSSFSLTQKTKISVKNSIDCSFSFSLYLLIFPYLVVVLLLLHTMIIRSNAAAAAAAAAQHQEQNKYL